MTPEQKILVQTSFAKVLPIAPLAATLFYARLFELDPSLRPMFKRDLTEQGRMLMSVLRLAVNGLDDLDKIIPAVQQLGVRYAAYHVRPEHYDTVGQALLWTLRKGLGDDFTPEVEEAWAAVYTLLANTMKEAAYSMVAA
jgi:hemoglobin-like flavoprotein